jgi:hypothetical protein
MSYDAIVSLPRECRHRFVPRTTSKTEKTDLYLGIGREDSKAIETVTQVYCQYCLEKRTL